jgi:hypothetical protein
LWYGAKLYLNNQELTELVIPEGIAEIKNYAFYDCSSLTSVSIGNGVTSISDSAFRNCSSLTSVSIGNGVTSIGYEAFEYCSSLKDFYCYATTPPTIYYDYYYNYYSFPKNGYDENTTLHVPARCGTKYKSSDWGKYFKTIKEM